MSAPLVNWLEGFAAAIPDGNGLTREQWAKVQERVKQEQARAPTVPELLKRSQERPDPTVHEMIRQSHKSDALKPPTQTASAKGFDALVQPAMGPR